MARSIPKGGRLFGAWVAAGYETGSLGDRKAVHYEKTWVWRRSSGSGCDVGFLHGHQIEHGTDGFLVDGLAYSADRCLGRCLVGNSHDGTTS